MGQYRRLTLRTDVLSVLVQGKYYEAAVTDIDPNTRVVSAAFPQHAGLEEHTFQVPYDILILSVGSVNNTFGIKVKHARPECTHSMAHVFPLV